MYKYIRSSSDESSFKEFTQSQISKITSVINQVAKEVSTKFGMPISYEYEKQYRSRSGRYTGCWRTYFDLSSRCASHSIAVEHDQYDISVKFKKSGFFMDYILIVKQIFIGLTESGELVDSDDERISDVKSFITKQLQQFAEEKLQEIDRASSIFDSATKACGSYSKLVKSITDEVHQVYPDAKVRSDGEIRKSWRVDGGYHIWVQAKIEESDKVDNEWIELTDTSCQDPSDIAKSLIDTLTPKSKSRPARTNWKKIQRDLQNYEAGDPIYEQTEAGSFLESCMQEVEKKLGIWSEPSVQLGTGSINFYTTDEDEFVFEYDYQSLNDEAIRMALDSANTTEFKRKYKAFLESNME